MAMDTRLTGRARRLLCAVAALAGLWSLVLLGRIVIQSAAWPASTPFVVVVVSIIAACNMTALAVFLREMRRPPR
jgi:hypothetical protein